MFGSLRSTVTLLASAYLSVGATVLAYQLTSGWRFGLLAIMLASVIAILLHLALKREQARSARAVASLLAAWRDGDFSTSLVVQGEPEMGTLTRELNALGDALRRERQTISQRELLLTSIVEQSRTAMVLTDADHHVISANTAAVTLFGRSLLSGADLQLVLLEAPEELRAGLLGSEFDGVLTVALNEEPELVHLNVRVFILQGRILRLLSVRQMTAEFSRQEVRTWKQLIRVLSHEINNSLGPILSLCDSATVMLKRSETERLPSALEVIHERAEHLRRFIAGYAEFSRLPNPKPSRLPWHEVLRSCRESYGIQVAVAESLVAFVDVVQIQQVLINLIKNAIEAGSALKDIECTVVAIEQKHLLMLDDRGSGMQPEVMSKALLPFYSTKREGTGIGLALAREIIEAHNGRFSLRARAGGGLQVRMVLPAG